MSLHCFIYFQCYPPEAVWLLVNSFALSADEPTQILILDGGCSPASESLAALSGSFYNVTTVRPSSLRGVIKR